MLQAVKTSPVRVVMFQAADGSMFGSEDEALNRNHQLEVMNDINAFAEYMAEKMVAEAEEKGETVTERAIAAQKTRLRNSVMAWYDYLGEIKGGLDDVEV